MNMIENLKDLERFFKLCRKQGVTKADLSALSFEFGEVPVERASYVDTESADLYANFPTGELTPEQLMYYSAGGLPENDPVLRADE
jgi:hypothetical protein